MPVTNSATGTHVTAASVCRVPGKVVGKMRPRFTTAGGAARAYTPRKSLEFENRVAAEYRKQGGRLHRGAVQVTVAYRRPLPKSLPRYRSGEWDEVKPDLDNVAKSVLDALNGLAYEDDSSVVMLTAYRLPRVAGQEEELLIKVEDADSGLRDWMVERWQRFTR